MFYTEVYQPPVKSRESYICRSKMDLVSFFSTCNVSADQRIEMQLQDKVLPELFWPFHHDRWALAWMRNVEGLNGKSVGPRIVISPTHRRPIRKWPLAKYAELSRLLTEELGAHVTWLWGPGEEADIELILRKFGGVGLKAPPTSFAQMAALIKVHHLFIGNSNGPSHVAVAAGVPSLQLHGHTFAGSWCPSALDSPYPCHRAIQSPLFRNDAEQSDIMDAITVESVFNQAKAQVSIERKGKI
jgi:ADP-heptose:LPS heptosyltransferase